MLDLKDIKEDKIEDYKSAIERLHKVNAELTMKGAINGWLIDYYTKEKESLIERINDCKK